MRFWKGVLAGSLGALGFAAIIYAQAANDRVGIEARTSAEAREHSAHPMQPETYGTSFITYVAVPGADFSPTSSDVAYQLFGGQLAGLTNCGGACFRAPLHLPSGAKIVYLELDYIDGSATSDVTGSLVQCNYLGQACTYHPAAGAGPSDCVTTGNICSGAAFAGGAGFQKADLTPDGITVDNFYQSLFLNAATNSAGLTNLIGGMIVGYILQVSPGPATATFTDVPTTHPFFKFVEALHAAGITNGYPDGRFGVNDPITRGQMAVFLSSALGLQWPY